MSGKAVSDVRTAAHRLTEEDVNAILDAVKREVRVGAEWSEVQGMTLGGACSASQGALIDDLWEGHPDDKGREDEMTSRVRTYDRILGTRRAAADLPGPGTS